MTGLSSQHISGKLAVSKASVVEAFKEYDSSGAPSGYGTPKRYVVINPRNNRQYPQKTIYGIAKKYSQSECPSATDTRYALIAAGFRIVDLMSELQRQQTFEKAVRKSAALSSKARQRRLKKARKYPEKVEVTVFRFLRNSDVVAERLFQSSGKCDACNSDAPFLRRKDKSPFLEVHHKIRLADGGEDTLANTLALCPNCHRKAHHG